MTESIDTIVEELGPGDLDTIEVSGQEWGDSPWASYRTTSYPGFDLVQPPPDFDSWASFDLAICEQVLEHVTDPLEALRNLLALLRPGGVAIVSTPFLVRLHELPRDYWRFTPEGLRMLMVSAGFDEVEVRSWGNRRCVRSNLRRWTPYRPWRSLHNEEQFPLVVWASGARRA